MDLKKIILKYTAYNRWANEKIIPWLKSLDSNILYKTTLSSFSSIDLTLQHMKNAQNFWMIILAEGDTAKLDETIQFNNAETIMDDLLAGSQRMLDTFVMYTNEELLKRVSNGDARQSRYDFILHIINHNSYHRGQIVTMSRCLGVADNIPNMDYEFFLWEGH